jgi:hypothetical protein
MRWFPFGLTLLAALLLTAPAVAQEVTHPYRELRIPVPPGAKLVMEVDIHDDDLLGMYKSLLRGFNGQTLVALMNSMGGMMGQGTRPNGPGQPGMPPPAPGQAPGGPPSPLTDALANLNLVDVLREIHQIHMVVFSPAGGTQPDELLRSFEEPFRAEGGRRLLWFDMQGPQMQEPQAQGPRILMYGFREPRGFALMMLPGPNNPTIVMRADGYLNLEPVGPVVAAFVTMFGSMFGMRSPDMAPEPPVVTPPPPPPSRRTTPRRPQPGRPPASPPRRR